MKAGIPLVDEQISPHFGRSEKFAFFDVDESSGAIRSRTSEVPPPHEPGVLPQWLKEHGVEVVICGGLGPRAEQLLRSYGIRVISGVRETDPERAVVALAAGGLKGGENPCDH